MSALSTNHSFLVSSFLSDLYIYSLAIQVTWDVSSRRLEMEIPENYIHYME